MFDGSGKSCVANLGASEGARTATLTKSWKREISVKTIINNIKRSRVTLQLFDLTIIYDYIDAIISNHKKAHKQIAS